MLPVSFDDTIVLCTVDRTRILHQSGGKNSLEEVTSFSGFQLDHTTLAVSPTGEDMLIQVTPFSVRLMTIGRSGKLLHQWNPPLDNLAITVAGLNSCQCVLSYGSGTLVYLEIENNSLVEKR